MDRQRYFHMVLNEGYEPASLQEAQQVLWESSDPTEVVDQALRQDPDQVVTLAKAMDQLSDAEKEELILAVAQQMGLSRDDLERMALEMTEGIAGDVWGWIKDKAYQFWSGARGSKAAGLWFLISSLIILNGLFPGLWPATQAGGGVLAQAVKKALVWAWQNKGMVALTGSHLVSLWLIMRRGHPDFERKAEEKRKAKEAQKEPGVVEAFNLYEAPGQVKAFAKKSGKPESEVERLWEKAKRAAEKQGRDRDYAYIVGIWKKMLGIR